MKSSMAFVLASFGGFIGIGAAWNAWAAIQDPIVPSAMAAQPIKTDVQSIARALGSAQGERESGSNPVPPSALPKGWSLKGMVYEINGGGVVLLQTTDGRIRPIAVGQTTDDGFVLKKLSKEEAVFEHHQAGTQLQLRAPRLPDR